VATINDLADGIEARLATVSGLHGSSEWQNTPNPPAVLILVQSGPEAAAFDTLHQVTFRLLVLVTLANGIAKAQRQLHQFMDASGTYSIKAALDGDDSLGSVAQYCLTEGMLWRDEHQYEINTVNYWGASLENLVVYYDA